MSKDDRLYGKFTLEFPRHRKIAILSDAAYRCLHEAILYSREEQTDGLLARRYALARWSLDVLTELCANDDENPSLSECDKGWIIHDFDQHQETKADIEDRRKRNKLAGQKGGLAKAKRNGKHVASKVLSEVLSENLAEKEKEKYITTSSGTVPGERSVSNARERNGPKDRMGRPSMSLTAMTGGDETPPEPPPPDRRIPGEAKRIVREVSGLSGLSRKVQWACEIEFATLLNQGIPYDEVLEAASIWFREDNDCFPGNIKHFHSRLVRKQTQPPPLTKKEQRIVDNLSRKEGMTREQRVNRLLDECEQRQRKAITGGA